MFMFKPNRSALDFLCFLCPLGVVVVPGTLPDQTVAAARCRPHVSILAQYGVAQVVLVFEVVCVLSEKPKGMLQSQGHLTHSQFEAQGMVHRRASNTGWCQTVRSLVDDCKVPEFAVHDVGS